MMTLAEDGLPINVVTGDGLMRIGINRPDKKNAINRQMYSDLATALQQAETNPDIRVVFIHGTVDCFTSGNDLADFVENPPTGEESPVFQFLAAISQATKPLVAAVNGPALAGGMDLASMCDLRLAVRGARFGQPQVKLGIPAAFELTRSCMNESMARRLCLTGDQVSAEEALAAGYVSAIFDDVDALHAAALDWASRIAVAAASGTMKRQFVSAQPEIFASDH